MIYLEAHDNKDLVELFKGDHHAKKLQTSHDTTRYPRLCRKYQDRLIDGSNCATRIQNSAGLTS
ncbi:MAG: hypothetical protein P8I83_00290 [Paracoccaceae bacterium]|nr:hypothetical protein [Paracoccaceae bacterium]